jgi:hypothetical protein
MTQPFEAPSDDGDEIRRGPGALPVVLAWMLAGVLVGTAIGLTVEAFSGWKGVIGALAVGMGLSAAVMGQVAFWSERHQAEKTRPLVADAKGGMSRPVHGGLWALPIGVSFPALLWLGFVGVASTGNVVVGLIFLGAALSLGVVARKVGSDHAVALGHGLLAEGREGEGLQRLKTVEKAWWTTQGARNAAQHTLGILSLQTGDLEGAAGWFSRVGRGRLVGAFATVGLALVRVLQDRLADAEGELLALREGGSAHRVQSQVDEVRLLLVLRREGAPAARELGERLLGPQAGHLFLGVLAAARSKGGDPDGARELLDGPLPETLRADPVARQVVELRELLSA